MADMWVGVNGADEALRQVNAEMLGGARALADQAAAQVVAIVWGASAAGHAKALASWGADRVVIVESEAAPGPRGRGPHAGPGWPPRAPRPWYCSPTAPNLA